MGVGPGLYMCDVVVKSSRSLSHLLMSSCISLGTVLEEDFRTVCYKFFTSPAGTVAKYCDEYVCLYVCLSVREDISRTTRAILTKFFVHVAYVRCSDLFRHVDDRPGSIIPDVYPRQP